MIDPIINISMETGTNIGSGGMDYSPSINNGIFENGKFILNGSGCLSVPTPFMQGNNPWTIAFTIDNYIPSISMYSRFARGNNDVPSLFYTKNYACTQAKLAYASINTSYATIEDKALVQNLSNGALGMALPQDTPLTFVFMNDNTYITLWINGIKTLQESASRYSSDKWANIFSIGNDATGNDYNMNHLECSMLKIWNNILTQEDIYELNNIGPKELKYAVYTNFYPSENYINYSVSDLTINYIIPVLKGSTYVITLNETGNRLRAVFTTMDPDTISTSINATTIIMNPSISPGYKLSYYANNNGWLVLYVSNAGEYPNVTFISNGVGGDGIPLYDRKYLFRSGNIFYNVVNNQWNALNISSLSKNIFLTYGINWLPNNDFLLQLTSPEIFYWHDSMDDVPKFKIDVTGVPPVPQTVITCAQDMSDSTILGIEGVQATCSDDILFAVSFDDGETWRAHDGERWIVLDLDNTGMNRTTLENIDLEAWREIQTSNYYKFKFILPSTESYLTSLVVDYIN